MFEGKWGIPTRLQNAINTHPSACMLPSFPAQATFHPGGLTARGCWHHKHPPCLDRAGACFQAASGCIPMHVLVIGAGATMVLMIGIPKKVPLIVGHLLAFAVFSWCQQLWNHVPGSSFPCLGCLWQRP